MSLKNIFKHKPNRFVELLIEQATLTERGLEDLINYLHQANDKNAKKINRTEKEADEVRRVLIEELMKTFVTPYDREDIFSLSREIDDVLDYANTTEEPFVFVPMLKEGDYFLKISALFDNNKRISTDAIPFSVKSPDKAGSLSAN